MRITGMAGRRTALQPFYFAWGCFRVFWTAVSAPPESRLPALQECRHAFLVILAHARQRELVEVHMAGEIVERMRQAVDRQSVIAASKALPGSATSSTSRHS
jgi:hypothetical protein